MKTRPSTGFTSEYARGQRGTELDLSQGGVHTDPNSNAKSYKRYSLLSGAREHPISLLSGSSLMYGYKMSNDVTLLPEGQHMAEKTPQERAVEAAEALSADGHPVTARAVRERARVSMSVATPVAREWNARASRHASPPPVPNEVRTAIDTQVLALWERAIREARAEHEEEREGLHARFNLLAIERDEALDQVEVLNVRATALQEQLDRAGDCVADLETSLERAHGRIAEAEAALERTKTQLEEELARAPAAEGLSAGLREALAALTPAPKSKS